MKLSEHSPLAKDIVGLQLEALLEIEEVKLKALREFEGLEHKIITKCKVIEKLKEQIEILNNQH